MLSIESLLSMNTVMCFVYKMMHPRLLVVHVLVLLVSMPVAAENTNSGFSFLDPEIIVDPDFKNNKKNRPRTIAILPFKNTTDSKDAADTVRRAIYNHFSSLGYSDMELKVVDIKLKRNLMVSTDQIYKASAAKLVRALGVDAIIKGTVTTYSRSFALVASSVSVGAELEMFRLSDNKRLWRGKQTARSLNGSLPTSPFDAVTSIISNILNIRKSITYRVSDEFARDIIKTIPNIDIEEVLKPPVISLVAHSGVGGPKKVGDTLDVVMEGEKSQSATFNIGVFKKRLLMNEIKPGVYRGQYQIVPGDNVTNATLVTYLTNNNGVTSKWIDFLAPVIIDTIPPESPHHLKIQNLSHKIKLHWYENTDKDLSKYEIWRSLTPLSGYEKVAETEFVEFIDKTLDNNKAYFYKIRAADRAGNYSEYSNKIKGFPVRSGPTDVDQDIELTTTWYKSASPYIVKKSIVIKKDAELNIEPGTEIRLLKTTGITVKGKLTANGTKRDVITMQSQQNGQKWTGLLFDHSRKENLLSYINLIESVHGIVVNFSNLDLNNSAVKNNRYGIQVIESNNVKLLANLFSTNQHAGIKLTRSSIEIKNNKIIYNGVAGIILKDAIPKVKNNHIYANESFNVLIANQGNSAVDLSDNYWQTTSFYKITNALAGHYKNKRCLKGKQAKKGYKSLNKRNYTLRIKNLEKQNLDKLLRLGVNDYKSGHYSNSYSKLSYYTKSKAHPAAFFLLGKLFGYRGEQQKALISFQKAIKMAPENSGYNYHLGLHLLKLGKVKQAQQLWKKYLQENEPHQQMINALTVLR